VDSKRPGELHTYSAVFIVVELAVEAGPVFQCDRTKLLYYWRALKSHIVGGGMMKSRVTPALGYPSLALAQEFPELFGADFLANIVQEEDPERAD
jgi:hypothetical protein